MYSSKNSALLALLSGFAAVELDGEGGLDMEAEDVEGAGYRYSKTRSSRRIHFRARDWRLGDCAKDWGVKSR